MSSVASVPGAAQQIRPFSTPRGLSAADDAAEHPSSFAMLLDANSPAPDPAPAPLPDRPAQTNTAPQYRDDSQPSDNRREDSSQPSPPDGGNTQNIQGIKSSNAGCKTTDSTKDTGDKGGTKDNEDAGNTDDSNDGQKPADGNACAQLTPALTIVGAANAPAAVSTDNTTNKPADAACTARAVAPAGAFAPANPAIVPPGDQASQPKQSEKTQTASDCRPADPSQPIDLTDGAAPAAPTEIKSATQPAPLKIQADTIKPVETACDTGALAPSQPAGDTTSAIQNAPADPTVPDLAKPDPKVVLPHEIDLIAPAEPFAQINVATPATPATQAATTTSTKKVAWLASAAPAADTDAQAPLKLQGEPAPIKFDSSGADGNPAILATHEKIAKSDGAKPDGTKSDDTTSDGTKSGSEPQIDRTHLIGSDRIASTEISSVPVSRIGTPASATMGGVESMSASSAATPAIQATSTLPPTNAAALTAAMPGAAIPMAGLPVEIATQAKDGKNRFEIRLDPPELGRIDVRLDIDNKGIVTSRLVADRPETLDLLRRDAPQIERALQDAGLKTSDQGLQFSLRDQSFADRSDRAPPPATQLVLSAEDTMPIEAARQGYGRLFGLGGGVDIRV